MKILYVGDEDNLSNGIMERLIKEGNDIYLLTTQLSLKAKRDKIKYKYYLNNGVEDVKNVFISVKPEVVIFVGNGYVQEIWNEEQNNLSLLAVALEESKSSEIEKFIFFSSTEVYSDQIEDI
ncbi:MAG: NAD-dependent epimerase/dehydratase family protein, partial [Clostridium sp.]|nr:NAD-dependent epimerase/dehydratase family protein [Clostridium sp.]